MLSFLWFCLNTSRVSFSHKKNVLFVRALPGYMTQRHEYLFYQEKKREATQNYSDKKVSTARIDSN